MKLDATHDPALRSWVACANVADTDFPIQNLPFGRFRRGGPLPFNRAHGALDLTLEAWRQTAAMRAANESAVRLSQSNVADSAYWTAAQLVTHLTVKRCNLQPGDLFGSSTLSSARPEQGGSLLELSLGGKQAITLPNGEPRTFLQDGDTVILRGHCARPSLARIGLGEVSGTVLGPAPGRSQATRDPLGG